MTFFIDRLKGRASTGFWAAVALGLTAATAAILYAIGREPICTCGTVKLWVGAVMSSDNSQHLTDWYTPSHVIHGLIFYGVLWLVARRLPIGARLAIAIVVEAAWEIVENSPAVIERYRTQTIALDYFGDSILNSVADIGAMAFGFWLAARLPVWASVALAVAAELFVGWMIRDNLTLNVIMLLWPVEAIKVWQGGA